MDWKDDKKKYVRRNRILKTIFFISSAAMLMYMVVAPH